MTDPERLRKQTERYNTRRHNYAKTIIPGTVNNLSTVKCQGPFPDATTYRPESRPLRTD